MVCSGITGRLEVANTLIEMLNLQDSIKINAVKSDYFKKTSFKKTIFRTIGYNKTRPLQYKFNARLENLLIGIS